MITNDPSIHPDDTVQALIAFTVHLNVNGVRLSCVTATSKGLLVIVLSSKPPLTTTRCTKTKRPTQMITCSP